MPLKGRKQLQRWQKGSSKAVGAVGWHREGRGSPRLFPYKLSDPRFLPGFPFTHPCSNPPHLSEVTPSLLTLTNSSPSIGSYSCLLIKMVMVFMKKRLIKCRMISHQVKHFTE